MRNSRNRQLLVIFWISSLEVLWSEENMPTAERFLTQFCLLKINLTANSFWGSQGTICLRAWEVTKLVMLFGMASGVSTRPAFLCRHSLSVSHESLVR